MKKSIIIYADCIAILEELTYEQAGRLFKAILSYVNEEPVTETEGDPAVSMAFKVLKNQIDRDTEKYVAKCEKNKQIAIAREKRRKELREQMNTNVHERKRTHTNVTDNDNDTENDSDNESTNVDNNNLPLSLRSKGSLHSKAGATQPKSFREKVLRYFNDKMEGKSIAPIRSIKDGTKRSEHLKARVREYGREAVFQMIDKAAGSQFLNGYNKKGFTATFDWLILPNNFIKVLEGNYNIENNSAEKRLNDAAAIIARRLSQEGSGR